MQTTRQTNHTPATRCPAPTNPQDVALLAHRISGDQQATTHVPILSPYTPAFAFLVNEERAL